MVLDNDPILERENAGYVSMAGELLRNGTKSKTKAALDEAVDFLGASLSTYASGAYASSLSKHADKIMELMAEVILQPSFPEDELEKLKKQTLSALAANKDDANVIASEVAQVLRFGKAHPYGEIVTEESVENIDIEEIKEYYQTYFRPNNAYFAVVGDIKKKEAEKLVKRHMRRYSSGMFHIDLGEIYELQGNARDADKAYREAISTLPASQGMVIRIANEFIRRNKLERALETYNHGKKLLDGRYPFSYEIASLHGTMGNEEQMIREFLDLLDFNDAYIQTIQNALSRSIDFQNDTEGVELIRVELLRRVQGSPQSTIYAEMLTWFFLQQRDFRSALIQLKALDKRLNEDGRRLLNFAGLCINNGAFQVASEAYDYIAEKGSSNPYYAYARAGALRARFEHLSRTFPIDTTELGTLHRDYSKALANLGVSNETMGLMHQKANLEAYYLGDLYAANLTLNEAMDVPGVHEEQRARVKLDLVEVLIARNYIWDASLLASQIEKDFKDDVLGHSAKLLNAKISYYAGDFSWAQAQLDVLKASTSKLISNDAMDLSLLITDNFNLDTITEPMMMAMPAPVVASGKSPKTSSPSSVALMISRYWNGARMPAGARRSTAAPLGRPPSGCARIDLG